MLSIIILGPGCANCARLSEMASLAAEGFRQRHPDFVVTINKLTDPTLFADFGLLHTPGLVINDQLVSEGRLPSPKAIEEWLEAAVLNKAAQG